MGNIISYLKWRGDIGFLERPFCNVDNLVLAELSYFDFSGIVPNDEHSVLVSDIAEQMCHRKLTSDISGLPADFISAFVNSRRFRTARLSHFVDMFDEVSQIQFSAIHIALEDGTTYIAFRGTSDAIVGWREDFSMSYQIMPSQKQAADYLKQTMTDSQMQYRIGGHSKGGNLAIYAAISCPKKLQEQMINIYSNDGPGLCPDIIDIHAYQEIRNKIVRISPQFCLIGKLFEQDHVDFIVKSSISGAGAHEGFSWEIEGDQFILCENFSEDSLFYNDIFHTWIVSADMEQRAAFTRDFFDALEAGGAKSISEITANGMDGIEAILISLIRSEHKTKIVLGKLFHSALQKLKNINLKNVLRQKEMLTGILLFFIGLFLIAVPQLAAKCISVLLGLSGLLFLGKRIVSCAFMTDYDFDRKKIRLVIYLILMCLIVSLMNHVNALTGFTELLLSAGFLGVAYYELRKMVSKKYSLKKCRKFICFITALICTLFGILPATTMALSINLYTLTAGTFILLLGAITILKALFKEDHTASPK